jgi:SAM-dependent methyltransferase
MGPTLAVDPRVVHEICRCREIRVLRDARSSYRDAMADEPLHRHYDTDIDEDARLRRGLGRLELARVQEIVRRHLAPASHVLDVGGATGVHSEWLLDDGHTVHLVDLLPGHVDRATASLGGRESFAASVGDGRALPVPDASVDAVLLLGPLYHLTDRADRLAVWREASRVLVPGGVVIGMGISRFASLFDGLAQEYLFDPAFRAIVAQDLATGVHENPTGDPRWFTTAYFHRPEELADEAAAVGLDVRETVGVEGLAHWIKPLGRVFDDGADPADREAVLAAARSIEAEPTLLGLSSHLLTVATRT